MHLYSPPKVPTEIPVVDLGGGAIEGPGKREHVAGDIHRACRETGFFYVANHGVDPGLVGRQFAQAKRFFDLPLDEKMALHMRHSKSTAGYEPVGGQVLDSQDAGSSKAPADLKESFYSGRELRPDHPYVLAGRRSFGNNQWPAQLPGFREATLEYSNAIRALGDRLLSLLATSLNLPADWFAPSFVMAPGNLRMIKYPPQPAKAEFNQIGAGAHTDWGGITILAQDDVGGLEVRNAAGDWIAARPIPDTFVINLGDLMARWTNGVYNSNFHRVMNNAGDRDRYSVVMFYSPDPEAVIEPIEACVTPDNPRRFADCTASEHMVEMFRRSYGYAPG